MLWSPHNILTLIAHLILVQFCLSFYRFSANLPKMSIKNLNQIKIHIRKIQVILDIEKIRLYCLLYYLLSTLFEIRCIYCVFGHILIFTKSVSMFCLFLRMIKCAQNSWSLPGPEVLSVTKNKPGPSLRYV